MRTTLLAIAVTVIATAALAQAPAGPELLVSGTSALGPGAPSVAADGAGNFVVSWVQLNVLPDTVYARRYDAQGTPQGPDIVVSQYLGGSRLQWARVGSAPAGDFVVVWSVSYGVDAGKIEARRFGSAGAPLGPPFQVSTFTTTPQAGPVVAVQANGAFMVAWVRGDAIAARAFASDGSALGVEFTVPAGTAYRQGPAAIAADAAGGFVVVWAEDEDLGYDDQVRGQRYSAAGVPVGADFQVNSATGAFAWPSVAVQADGRFLVAWSESSSVPPLIHTRRFAADGSPDGGQRTVRLLNLLETDSQTAVAGLPAGGYVVAWSNSGVDESGRAVEAVRIDATGAPVGRPIVVDSTEWDDQFAPALAADPLGNVMAVWADRYVEGIDIRYYVLGQRFGRLGTVALAVDTAAGGSSDGNHVLEPGEDIDLRPTWRNNQGAPAALRGTLLSLSPPPDGAAHTITDSAGSYGTVADGGVQACIDCYRLRVDMSSRSLLHWDVIATESVDKGAGTPSDGQVRWRVHVGDSFTDVARASPFYRFVETVLHRGITTGCSGRDYCGASAVTRAQMAPFVLLAREGRGYGPGYCGAPLFADVPNNDPFCRWIEELARRGVVSGCGGGNYCPTAAVTREQMAVFVLRTLDPTLSPPACVAGSEMFADVPASSGFCRWIEELARRGVVTGCGGGNYCPTAAVTREQMSVFLTATFGLTLYGP